ncbi:MAG: ABC transporter ATP-binding protein [Nitrospirae bacterium]|nr:ABC transporter ATP-binding protein [Nitrospirota bacterium]
MNVFEVKNISYSYGNRVKALEGISFDVSQGESLTLIGTNGSGKTTLLYILNGLLEPCRGEVFVFGTSILKGYPAFLRQRVSLLFQNSQAQLFSLSVWDEMCFGPLQLGFSKDEIKEKVESIIEMLHIGHLRDRGPWELSSGEMKKVALGTCLSINPDVLLLDEPIAGLDLRSQVEITDIIIRLKEAGKAIITATHDLHIIEDVSDRTIVLSEDHRVLCEGNPHEVLNDHGSLLKANLIHKHAHKHTWYVHSHSHHGVHAHEHILQPEEVKPVPEDMDKLKKLLEHWEKHNIEHAKTYLEWAEKADEMGRADLARILRQIAERTEELKDLFRQPKITA